MNSVSYRPATAAAILVLMGLFPAPAEVTVSVTISGTIEELIPILQKLKELGIETGAAPGEDGLIVDLHSVAEGEAPAPAPEPEPVKPPLSLAKLTVEPAEVAPGAAIVISAGITDPDGVVDTVVATVHTQTALTYDLYDNGEKGDLTARDGIWSLAIEVPGGAALGEYRVSATAFDRNGEPVAGPDGNPLGVETSFRVNR